MSSSPARAFLAFQARSYDPVRSKRKKKKDLGTEKEVSVFLNMIFVSVPPYLPDERAFAGLS